MNKSMRITPFGRGLAVVVGCEATGVDNFLAFAAWYSLSRNLPDARVVIACRRPQTPGMDVFPWAYHLGVPVFYHRKKDEDLGVPGVKSLLLPADACVLDTIDDDTLTKINSVEVTNGETLCSPAKNSDPVSLCSLRGGCGLFVPSKWIHRGGHPFGKTDLYGKGTLTVNEKRVFSLWKKLCPLYDTIV